LELKIIEPPPKGPTSSASAVRLTPTAGGGLRPRVKCPRCGDEGLKSVQFKCGPQLLLGYEFGKDRIKMDWTYEFYGSIIDEEKKIIRGIATCPKCREESSAKMDELIQEARDKGRLKCPEEAKYLFECEINGKDALGVILRKLDKVYGGNRNIEVFEVTIRLDKDNIAVSAEPIGEE